MVIFNELGNSGGIIGGNIPEEPPIFGGSLIGGIANVNSSLTVISTGGTLIGSIAGVNSAEAFVPSGGVIMRGDFEFDYSYTATGGVSVFNCAIVSSAFFILTKYGPGDISFSLRAAKKGVLEKVCIKAVALNCLTRNCAVAGAGCFPLYKDKFNSLWFDEDLATQAQAIVLAQAHIDKIKAFEENLLRTC